MRLESLAVGAALVIGTACSDSSAPKPSDLVGGWFTVTEALHPTGTLDRSLSFAADGSFQYTGVMHGIYAGDPPGQLAAYTIWQGNYTVNGDQLVMTATREITWDSFYGPTSQPTVRVVNQSVFDQAHFTIQNNALVLNYLTYPADAPVPTTMAFFRMLLD